MSEDSAAARITAALEPEEHAAQRISAVLEPALSKAVNSAIAARAQDPISHVARALQASDGHAAEAAALKATAQKVADEKISRLARHEKLEKHLERRTEVRYVSSLRIAPSPKPRWYQQLTCHL